VVKTYEQHFSNLSGVSQQDTDGLECVLFVTSQLVTDDAIRDIFKEPPGRDKPKGES
jgi:hypothetical protein